MELQNKRALPGVAAGLEVVLFVGAENYGQMCCVQGKFGQSNCRIERFPKAVADERDNVAVEKPLKTDEEEIVRVNASLNLHKSLFLRTFQVHVIDRHGMAACNEKSLELLLPGSMISSR